MLISETPVRLTRGQLLAEGGRGGDVELAAQHDPGAALTFEDHDLELRGLLSHTYPLGGCRTQRGAGCTPPCGIPHIGSPTGGMTRAVTKVSGPRRH